MCVSVDSELARPLAQHVHEVEILAVDVPEHREFLARIHLGEQNKHAGDGAVRVRRRQYQDKKAYGIFMMTTKTASATRKQQRGDSDY